MLTVATVLRSGGDFKREHFDYLSRQINHYLTIPHEIVCLTDEPQGPNDIRLEHSWPGWWSKMEVFKLTPPVFYIDLDMIVKSNIDDLVQGHTFTQLRHFRLPDSPKPNSGLMAWGVKLSWLYTEFAAEADHYMAKYTNGGDEAFIRDHSPIKWEKWQEKFPGRVVSYKMDCKVKGPNGKKAVQIPEDASIVCFHGPPRPWNTPLWSQYAV